MRKLWVVLVLFLLSGTGCFAQRQTNYYSKSTGFLQNCDTLLHYLKRDTAVMALSASGQTLIHNFVYIKTPCQSAVFELLVNRGVDINAIDGKNETALDYAIREKDVAAIVKLHELGGKMSSTDRHSKIYKAVESNDIGAIGLYCRKEEMHGYEPFFWNTLFVGPRINYMQAKYGFLGIACPVTFQNIGFLPISHFGLSAGADFRLSKTLLLAPKISAEYRWGPLIARGGYMRYTDMKQHDNVVFGEIGLSLLSYLDLTYVRTFHLDNDPFRLGSNYFNLTVTIGLSVYER